MSDAIIKLQFPLACGCAGPKYVSKCERHQEEDRAAHERRLGLTMGAFYRERAEFIELLNLAEHFLTAPQSPDAVAQLCERIAAALKNAR